MRLRIPRESFLVFPTPSTLYDLFEGSDTALAKGLLMVLPLSLLVVLVTVIEVDGGWGRGEEEGRGVW